MKFKNPLIAVSNIDKTVDFYKKVFGLRVIMDFGANKTLTGGICLQTEETWRSFIDGRNVTFGGNSGELYFEEDDFDSFIKKLESMDGISYVHPVREYPWGQRVVRIYDPDRHILEIGENMKTVCRRFLDSGMTHEETARRMDVPIKFVKACCKN